MTLITKNVYVQMYNFGLKCVAQECFCAWDLHDAVIMEWYFVEFTPISKYFLVNVYIQMIYHLKKLM